MTVAAVGRTRSQRLAAGLDRVLDMLANARAITAFWLFYVLVLGSLRLVRSSFLPFDDALSAEVMQGQFSWVYQARNPPLYEWLLMGRRAGTGAHRLRRERLVRIDAVFGDDDDLSVLDIADVFRADRVERAGLRRQDVMAIEFAEHQRADAERVAGADELLGRQRDERIGAFELADGVDEAVEEAVALAAGNEMQDDLGVGRRLAECAVADELAAKCEAVRQVAVMGDGEAAGLEFGEERLDVAENGLSGRRITVVADGGGAGQAFDDAGIGEVIADKTQTFLGVEALAVVGDDAGGFLAAMLEGVEAECGDRRGVRVSEDAEDTALLIESVGFDLTPKIVRCDLARVHADCKLPARLLRAISSAAAAVPGPVPQEAMTDRYRAPHSVRCSVRAIHP